MTSSTRRRSTPASSPETSAALYLRRSSRKDLGANRSLREQETECRALAARLGLDVVEVYEEQEGTGASMRSRKRRPKWEQALADLDAGDRFRTVIVWALDRADRRGADVLAGLLTRHAATGRRILGVDGTDTSDERQRLATIIRGEIAREEAENIAKRVTRTKRTRRADGRWLGGRPPFGLRVVEGRVEPDPDTAPVARRIADEVLSGRSLWSIAADLNAEEIPSPSGVVKGWRVNSLSQILRAPAFAGLQSVRERKPSGGWPAIADVYLDEETRRPVSVGVGVITPAERSRILAALESRTREDARDVRRGKREVRSLLGDVLRCASCGGRTSVSGSGARKSYRCAALATGRECAAPFTAPRDALESYVGERFLTTLSTLEPSDDLLVEVAARWVARVEPGALADRQEAEDAVAALDADLARARRLAVSGVLTEEEAAEEMSRLRRLRVEAVDRLAALPTPAIDVSPLLDLVQSREAWEGLPVDERRSLLPLAIHEIRVLRASGRGVRFRPDERVEIIWHA
ncbi:recombinase family protein [Georgenia wutianyii]|uniref:Recombinase family protein n=1 Tax=Georgenia wutianyii TaxID=2585135 RepID=A0ABX5VM32_9MICO|nr:recombinase family protein [Georgenia wutianyii]QDB79532.1 recombinase family protein [Georgenia wutianyii]